MKVGYVRYISDNQSTNNIVENMEKAEADKIIFGISSESNDQNNFREYIETLKQGDVLIVDALDTLGNSSLDIIDILNLLNEKEIGIQVLQISLTEPEDIELKNGHVQAILKKYLIHILQSVDSKLKNNIRLSQSKGVNEIKSKRKKAKGRPKKYSRNAEDPNDREIYYAVISMLKNGDPISDIANVHDLSRTTVYRIKDEMEEDDHIN